MGHCLWCLRQVIEVGYLKMHPNSPIGDPQGPLYHLSSKDRGVNDLGQLGWEYEVSFIIKGWHA